MNCYAGSNLMLEKLFPRSRVAKLNKKKYAPKNLFQNVEALLFPFWVVLHLYHKFQGHVLNSQFLTCFWASQNKDSPNQISLVHKLHPGSKSGTSGSSIDFFRPPGQLWLNYCFRGISRLLSWSERANSVPEGAKFSIFWICWKTGFNSMCRSVIPGIISFTSDHGQTAWWSENMKKTCTRVNDFVDGYILERSVLTLLSYRFPFLLKAVVLNGTRGT